MTNKYIFLNYPLHPEAPTPPAIPHIELSTFLSIEDDGADVTMLKLTSHSGTHLDTPGHVIRGGNRLSDFGIDDFVFNNVLLINLHKPDTYIVRSQDLEEYISRGRNADFILLRFGYGSIRLSDPARYSSKSPGLGVESAQFIRENFPDLRGLGMDVPSLSCIEYLDQSFEAHHILFGGQGRKFLVIEDMNLEQDISGLTTLLVAPLLVDNIDGSPCTVFGILG